MRWGRVQTPNGTVRWASFQGDQVALASGTIATGFTLDGEVLDRSGIRVLAPILPSKIIAVAANYPKHAAEMGNPVPDERRLFLKSPSAVIGPDMAIQLPATCTRIDPEGELAVVIGQTMRSVSAAQSLDYVFGYTCLNDVTCRDHQKKDRIFGRAKNFDTFCPLGPWIVTDLDASDLAIHTAVNGEVRAKGRTREMTFDIPTLLTFISSIMTLLPGDIVATGTPPGVGPITAGDRVEIYVQGIGTLTNPVTER